MENLTKKPKICKFMINKKIKLENSCRSWKMFQNFNKRRAFNKAVGPGKNPRLINIGPTFIPDYRVGR